MKAISHLSLHRNNSQKLHFASQIKISDDLMAKEIYFIDKIHWNNRRVTRNSNKANQTQDKVQLIGPQEIWMLI